jgi:hypothetical protein
MWEWIKSIFVPLRGLRQQSVQQSIWLDQSFDENTTAVLMTGMC